MKKLNMKEIHKRTVKLSKGKCHCISTGKYTGQFQRLWFKCNHNHTFPKRWHSFQQRPWCPTCAKKNIGHKGHHLHRWNDKTVGQYIYNVTDGHYKYAPDRPYQSLKKPIRIIHMKPWGCGLPFHMTFDKFKQGERCPHCRYNNIRLSRDDIVKKARKIAPDYRLITKSQPQNVSQPLWWRHLKCGQPFKMSWNEFTKYTSSIRCPNCSKDPHKKLNYHIIGKRIYARGGGHYKLRMDRIHWKYDGELTPIYVEHLKCGTVFRTTWNDFQTGHRCPVCNSSHGEISLMKQCHKYHVPMIHSFKTTCYMSRESKNLHKPLHLDLFDTKDKVAVEYDGIQHNCITSYFKDFDKQLARDKKKSEWCAEHGIVLLRLKTVRSCFKACNRKQVHYFMICVLLPVLQVLHDNPKSRKSLIKVFNSEI